MIQDTTEETLVEAMEYMIGASILAVVALGGGWAMTYCIQHRSINTLKSDKEVLENKIKELKKSSNKDDTTIRALKKGIAEVKKVLEEKENELKKKRSQSGSSGHSQSKKNTPNKPKGGRRTRRRTRRR